MSDSAAAYPESRLNEAEAFLAMSQDELFAIIAREHPTRGVKEAKDRFDLVMRRCQGAICGSEHIHRLCTSRKAGYATHLVCAVADTVIHTLGVPVPAMVIATIAVHAGLDQLCKTEWEE